MGRNKLSQKELEKPIENIQNYQKLGLSLREALKINKTAIYQYNTWMTALSEIVNKTKNIIENNNCSTKVIIIINN